MMGAIATVIGLLAAILIPVIKVYLNAAVIKLERDLIEKIDKRMEKFEESVVDKVTVVVTDLLDEAGVITKN